MLVMDEAFDCWSGGKNPQDYHLYFNDWWQRDMEAMVLRDRNHPSVVMWSIGNEIPIRKSQLGFNLSKTLSDFVRARDPERRPVTSAYPGVGDDADDFFAPLDIAGYNYSPQRYVTDHKRDPDRVIVATESFPHQSFDYWQGVWDNDWVIGDFIWTAIVRELHVCRGCGRACTAHARPPVVRLVPCPQCSVRAGLHWRVGDRLCRQHGAPKPP